VADPLFGRASNPGKLRGAWPRTLAQEPINVGDRDYDSLYPCGFGLRTQ
jgi:beta-glucosidase